MPQPRSPASPIRKGSPSIARSVLSAAEVRRVQLSLDRLGDEFAKAIGRLKGHVEGSRGLARATGSDVALCHRVLVGLKARGAIAERLAQWPGTSGVRAVAEKVCLASGRDGLGGPLALAVEAYAAAIREMGGTHARLVRRLRATEGSGGRTQESSISDQVAARRSIVRGAADMLGYSAEVSTFVAAIRPIPSRPELMEGCSAWGLIGLSCETRGVCITSQNTQTRQVAGDLAGEVRWRPLGHEIGGRDGLLTEFSSDPVPLAAADSGDGVIRQMVEPSASRGKGGGRGGPVDIVLARHWSPDANPQYSPNPTWSQIFRMRHPVRCMQMDVYLHRSMLSNLPPSIGAYYWHPALASDPRGQWHDRLPGSARIELLTLPPSPSASDAWDRQPALTSRLFELVDWPTDEFVGFRCIEPMPVWGAAYYMTFDCRPMAAGKGE